MVRIKSAVLFNVVVLAVVGVLASGSPAQVATNVRSFTSGAMANPQFLTLSQGRDATIYGSTFGFFPTGGAIFRLKTNGAGGQIYAFDTTSGANPDGGLTLATDGNLYGTTSVGGTANVGVLFKISPSGVYTVLHNFGGGADGAFPAAPPTEASDGSLYGTTAGVVTNSTVYKYARDGSFTTTYQFNDPTKGVGVQWPLIEGADGSLYGAAPSGGTNSCGTIFRLSRSGVLLKASSFPCGAGGSFPDAPLVQTSDGTFYGTTDLGGTEGLGAIFKMDQKGKIAILYSFQGEPNDGARPVGGLTLGTDGKLYGIAGAGGSNNIGALFSITTTGTYSFLYSFSSDVGSSPEGTLLQHTNGSFYGATTQGGAHNAGAIFALNAGLQPFITFVLATGKVGQSAQILGQGLAGATGVSFNGVAATTFHVVSDTYMTAVVPSGATTGLVTVTAPGGTLTSNRNYRVINQSTKSASSHPQQVIPKPKK